MSVAGFIWDLDNTLYRYEGLTAEQGEVVVAQLGEDLGVKLPRAELRSRAADCFRRHGNHFGFLVTELGLPLDIVHRLFHERLDVTIVARRNEAVRQTFIGHPADHIILTHASRGWAERMLEHVGLREFFPDSHVLALEDVNFVFKYASVAPFERALDILSRPRAEVVVVEDTLDNLIQPHVMGLTTAWVHHGRPLERLPEHVQHQFANAAEALERL